MKQSKKYLLIALAVTMVLSIVATLVVSYELNQMNEKSNQVVMNVIALVKQHNPEISELEIAKILNNKADIRNVTTSLESFGITSDRWAAVENDTNSISLVFTVGVICLIEFIILLGIFLFYNRQKKREMDAITDYIIKLNRGVYSLDIEENTEDDTSLLKNEIYKTTVMLREQRERSIQDKISLKNSLSDISHQLKTPLTSIILMVESILDDENMPLEVRQEFLKDIRRSSGHISFLVQSLLLLSKLDADSIELKKNKEDACKILQETIQNVAVLAEIKGVELKCCCQNGTEIMCDYKWTVEAFTNIVKNCVEHTQEGGVVKLSAEQNKLYTKVTISDNGTGIAAKDLPHIFERFYKGENANKDSVGIGLALARTLIEKNGGFLRVDSEKGKGTKFVAKYFATTRGEREASV